MASLTDYRAGIAGVDSGAIKMNDFKSPIEMGLDAAGDAVKAWRAEKTYARQDEADRNAAALDDIAAKAFKLDVKANNEMIPSSVIQAKAQLDNSRNAVDQGLVPPITYQTQLQGAVDRAMADNPESAYEIATYMRTSGHDHFMFRELEADQARFNAISNSINQADTKALEYARQRGTPQNLPVTDQIASGYALQQADFNMDLAAKQAVAAKAKMDTDVAGAKFQTDQANKQGINGVQQWMAATSTPLYNQFNSLVSAAGNDQGKLDKLNTDLIPLLDNATNSMMASAQQKLIQMGIATPENVSLVKSQIDNMNGGLKAVFNDRSGALSKAVQNLQNQYSIDVTKAAPLIYKYGKLIGNSALADLLGPQSLVDEKLQKTLAAEWQGVAAGGTDATLHFNNIIQIMKGDKTLKDFTETESRQYIGGIVSGKRATEAAIINDGATHQDKGVYMNTYGQLLNATNDFTPASDVKDMKNASGLVFTRTARLAMDKLSADANTKEQGEALGMASHGESIKMIQNLLGSREDPGSIDIKYDSNKGVFVLQDKQRNAADRAIARNLSGDYDRVATLNVALDHAVKTSKYDSELPKGVTPKQLRDAYANNRPIRDKDGKVLADPNKAFNDALNNLSDQLRATPLNIQQADTKQRESSATGEGSPVNNPGNLRASPTSFQQFGSLEEGIAAADKNLASYGSKYGIDTLEKAISRWAPKADNNDTDAYIKFVADQTGYESGEKIDLSNPRTRARILSAMFQMEGTKGITPGQVMAAGGSSKANSPL